MNDEEKDNAFETTVNNFASTLKIDDVTEDDKERIRKNREISTSNLIPAKPGEVRNPAGRPKDIKYISEGIRQYLREHPEEALAIVTKVISEAKAGNIPALKELLDRSEGKVTEVIELDTTLLQEKLARLRGYRATE